MRSAAEGPGRRRRPTQVDLARASGVSQATVSQVINETSDKPAAVLPETRRRILAAAAELGYAVNTAARSLRGGRNHLLGLYTFESVFPARQRDFYFPFLLGVEEETTSRGYDLLLFSTAGANRERPVYVDGVNRLKVADGCVLLGRHIDRDILTALVREDFPFVFIGKRKLRGAQLNYVAADYATSTQDLVRRCVEAGHTRIALVRDPDGREPGTDRLLGYRRGLTAAGMPADDALIATGPLEPATLSAWLASGVTALLVEPDETDEGVARIVDTAGQLGLGVPDDLSIAVLGDPTRTPAGRDWTCFTLRRTEMARRAVSILIGLLDGDDEPRQELVGCDVVAGTTLADAPGAGR